MLEFKLPEIGEGVVEGEIVRWHKQPGDFVHANEALVEVMTDKATIEVPSPIAATLQEIRAQVGDICAVEQVIAILAPGAAQALSPASASSAQTPATAPAVTSAPVSTEPVLATPAARALARESGIDLHSLPLDERGRITKGDVMRAAESRVPVQLSVGTGPASQPAPVRPVMAAPVAIAVAPAVAAPAPVRTAALAKPAAPAKPVVTVAGDEEIPFRGMRRKIAEGMVRSYTTAVHYTYVEQVNVTRLVKLRADAKTVAAEQGVVLTFLPFIVKAVVHALKKFPIVNAELDEVGGRIIVKKRYNIGVAAATDQGLMVPVLHGADRMSILDIGREIARLGEAARKGGCTREELTNGTFTISSLGQIGGVLATPIINFPEVGILGVHAIRKVPIVDERDNIVVGHLMNLSVSLDHRVVDGFEGANFLQEVRRFLEDPNLLLLAGI